MAVHRADDYDDETPAVAPATPAREVPVAGPPADGPPTDGPPTDGPPTEQLLTGPIGDRCANCDVPLAPDQRYCLNCGERRGRSHFVAGSAPVREGPVAVTPAMTTAPLGPRRGSAGMTLIAGVATLILAMGVGVLIGQNNAPATTSAKAPQVIVNGGGGSGTSAGAGTTAGTGPTKPAKTVKVVKSEKIKAARAAAAAKPTAAAVQKAGNAAAKVTGGSNAQKPTVQTGQACAPGSPGCTNGKFTGTFFGQ